MDTADYWAWREQHGPPPCAGHTDLFFPNDNKPGHSPARVLKTEQAKNICRTCIAIDLCYEASIVTVGHERRIEPGIWAGRTQMERCKETGLNPLHDTGNKYSYMVAQRTRALRRRRTQ
jgi:hypothetical protein